MATGGGMILADRIEAVLVEQGPMPAGRLAKALGKRREEVDQALTAHPARFVHNGRAARASRWAVALGVSGGTPEPEYLVPCPPVAAEHAISDLVGGWRRDLRISDYVAREFVAYWIETGLLESVDGNGSVRPTERGIELSRMLNGAR